MRLLHTGGTIGMVPSPQGLVPAPGVLEAAVGARARVRISSMRKMILIQRDFLNSFENAFAELSDGTTGQGSRQLRNGPKSSPAHKAAPENRIAPNAKQRLAPFWATISPVISSL